MINKIAIEKAIKEILINEDANKRRSK